MKKIFLLLSSLVAAQACAEEAIGPHIKHVHAYVQPAEVICYVILAVMVVVPLIWYVERRRKKRNE